jgi:hypothetical protein
LGVRTAMEGCRRLRAGAIGVACVATLAAPSAAVPSAPAGHACPAHTAFDRWSPGIAAARRWSRARNGDVSFAVRTGSREWGLREHHRVPTASVLKAMLLIAYLDMPSVRSRRLGPADRALLVPMIRRSDNTAATRVRGIVGDLRLVGLARSTGMTQFRPAAIWGLSQTTAADQARFFLRIDHTVVARHRAFAMTQLRSIVASQRWGIGRIRLPGWTVYFKGGWGTGTGRVDHLVALLTSGCRRVSVAVMTTDDGTHMYGKQTLFGVFRRLLAGLPTGAETAVPPGN